MPRRVQCPQCDCLLDNNYLRGFRKDEFFVCDICGTELEIVETNPVVVDIALPDDDD